MFPSFINNICRIIAVAVLSLWCCLSHAQYSVTYHIIRQLPGFSAPAHLSIRFPHGGLSGEEVDPELLNQAEQLQYGEFLIQGERSSCEHLPPAFCPEGIQIPIDEETNKNHVYLPLTENQHHYLFTTGKPEFANSHLVYSQPDDTSPSSRLDMTRLEARALLTEVTLRSDEPSGNLSQPPFSSARKSVLTGSGGGFFGNDNNFKPGFGGGGVPSDQVVMLMTGLAFHASEFYDDSLAREGDTVIIVTDSSGYDARRIVFTAEQWQEFIQKADEAASEHLERLQGSSMILRLNLKDIEYAATDQVPGIISCMDKPPVNGRSAQGAQSSQQGTVYPGSCTSSLYSTGTWGSNGGDQGDKEQTGVRCSLCGRIFNNEREKLAHESESHQGRAFTRSRGHRKMSKEELRRIFKKQNAYSATLVPTDASTVNAAEMDNHMQLMQSNQALSSLIQWIQKRELNIPDFMIDMSSYIELSPRVITARKYMELTKLPPSRALKDIIDNLKFFLINKVGKEEIEVNQILLAALVGTSDQRIKEGKAKDIVRRTYSESLSMIDRAGIGDHLLREYIQLLHRSRFFDQEISDTMLGHDLEEIVIELASSLPGELAEEMVATTCKERVNTSRITVSVMINSSDAPDLIIWSLMANQIFGLSNKIDTKLKALWKTASDDLKEAYAHLALEVSRRNFLNAAPPQAAVYSSASVLASAQHFTQEPDFLGYRLTTEDLSNVVSAIWDARARWKEIGSNLGLKSGDIESISLNNQCNTDRCFRDMLAAWLREAGTHINWTTLLNVLKSPQVGMGYLAEVARSQIIEAQAERNRKTPQMKKVSFKKVQSILWEARCQYYNIGIELDISPNTLDSIRSSQRGDVDNCFNEVIKAWIKTQPKTPLETLQQAFRSPVIGYGLMVNRLASADLFE